MGQAFHQLVERSLPCGQQAPQPELSVGGFGQHFVEEEGCGSSFQVVYEWGSNSLNENWALDGGSGSESRAEFPDSESAREDFDDPGSPVESISRGSAEPEDLLLRRRTLLRPLRKSSKSWEGEYGALGQ